MQLDEQETTINFSRTDDTAYIWTSDPTVMTKLDKFVEAGTYKLDRVERIHDTGEICGKWYTCPKQAISFRKKLWSEERRKARSEAMIAAGIRPPV